MTYDGSSGDREDPSRDAVALREQTSRRARIGFTGHPCSTRYYTNECLLGCNIVDALRVTGKGKGRPDDRTRRSSAVGQRPCQPRLQKPVARYPSQFSHFSTISTLQQEAHLSEIRRACCSPHHAVMLPFLSSLDKSLLFSAWLGAYDQVQRIFSPAVPEVAFKSAQVTGKFVRA